MMTLLKEPRRVANYVQYRIGILLKTIASHNQLGLADLQMKLCNHAVSESLLITKESVTSSLVRSVENALLPKI